MLAHRVVGLTLGGAKSDHTALVVLEIFQHSSRVFLKEINSSLGQQGEQSSDDILVKTLNKWALIDGIPLKPFDPQKKMKKATGVLCIDAPLDFPPCFSGCLSRCTSPMKCPKKSVQLMKDLHKKLKRLKSKVKNFTPYSQRAVDLYLRCAFPQDDVAIEESLGANLGPKSFRGRYLLSKLKSFKVIESQPKIVAHTVLKDLENEIDFKISAEDALEVRGAVLERMSQDGNFFIYDKDYQRILESPLIYHAFVLAWMGYKFLRKETLSVGIEIPNVKYVEENFPKIF